MYFGKTDKLRKKIHTGFRLSTEALAQLNYLVKREENNLESNNLKANRTNVVQGLLYNALTDEERRKVRESIR